MTLKHELLQIASVLSLPSTRFRAVGAAEWEPVMKKIEDKFVRAPYGRLRWWWTHFKFPHYGMQLPVQFYEVLHNLLPTQAHAWFIVEEGDKHWLFEGRIDAIQQVLAECYFFEFYIVSKKYDWLLCETHHDVLCGIGDSLVEKMKQVKQQMTPDESV